VPTAVLVCETSAAPWQLTLQAALLLPLLWRRRAPGTVLCAVAAAGFAQGAAQVRTPADAAVLVALYTVASRCGYRRVLAACVLVEVGALAAAVRWSTDGRYLPSAAGLTAMVVPAAVTGTNQRTRRAHLAALEDRAVRLERERDQRARLAVAAERARIARDLHDIVSHNLSVMVALADAAAYAGQCAPDRADAAVRQISGTGRQALTDMRRLLGVLRDDEPDALRHPVPGTAQLDALVDQVQAAGLPVRLTVEGDPAGIPAAARLTVYRLVQESLTNTLKHAPSGTRAEATMRCAPDAVTVEVVDGCARCPPRTSASARSGGHGIHGMRERLAAYGGTLEAGPLPGGGWRVLARFDPAAVQDVPAVVEGGAA
jgi:signal transduction histidine kinase